MLASVCAAAFALAFAAAGRGFFPLDQSIVFDGAYRIASGQVPYRDFLLPFGPVTFWLQAALFEIFGVGAFAYRLGGALGGALGAACAVVLLRALFPERRLLALLAGLLTAAWLCAPFGTLWMEQTAFLFSLLALAALVPSLARAEASPGSAWLAASGALAFLAFLGKQNAGGYLLWLYPTLIGVRFWPSFAALARAVAVWGAGLAAAAALFALWLFAASDPAAFFHHVFEIPAQLGAARFGRGGGSLFWTLVTGAGPDFVRLPLLASFGLALLVAFRAVLAPSPDRRLLLAASLCVGLALAQNLFIYTTLNAYENGLPFVGVIFALGAGLLLTSPAGARAAGAISLLAVLSAGYIAWRGVELSLSRQVHDIFAGASFPQRLAIARLSSLRWAQPTRLRGIDDPSGTGSDVTERDLAALVDYLAQRDANFFVFPDFTFLYGVLGRPSPQPLLFFHRGNSYSNDYEPELDQRIVDGLRANEVATVVLERVSWFGTPERLADFPRLKGFLAEGFGKTREIGIFEIYERTPAAGAAPR